MTNKVLDNFLEKHSIQILDKNKRAVKSHGVNVSFFNYADNYNIIDNERVGFETEPLYTVEISESELSRIAEFENRVFNNLTEKGHFNLFETLMEQKENEKYLINKYPGVKKAFEQYSLLLKMAQSGEMDN